MVDLGLVYAAAPSRVKTTGFARVLLGVAILSGLSAVDAFAQPAGVFVPPTGAMRTTRYGNTSTLLEDGRVLIAGGSHRDALNHCSNPASAELFDPSTGTFTATGNMIHARSHHAAALLPDGRVLMVGGSTCQNELQLSVELYDPATGTFTAAGNLGSSHTVTSGTLLRDGKVLIVGNIYDPPSASAYVYDPEKGVFSPASAVAVNGNSPLLLPDGRVLIAGRSIAVYEVAADALKLVASFPRSKRWGGDSATVLMNAKVLIAGGSCDEIGPCKTTDESSLYDPHRGTMEGTGLLAIPRGGQSATVLPGGRVLIAGGYGNDYDAAIPCPLEAEEYDPATGNFSYAGSKSVMACFVADTLLPDGRVLLTGGDGAMNSGAEIYMPSLRAASAASLTGPLAPESVASLFGSRLASTTAAADPLSLPTTLGGISLSLLDSSGAARLVPLFFVSPVEIRFAVPPGTVLGDATLELLNGPTQPTPAATRISNVAPAIFPFDDNLVAGPSVTRATINLSGPVDFAFYATGVRNRSTLGNVRAGIGGVGVTVLYAGPDPSGIPGLDLVKVHLPADFLGRGRLDLALSVDGIPSNTASVEIRGIRSVNSIAPRATSPSAPRGR